MSRIALLTQLPSLIDQCAALADGIGVTLAVASPMTGGWQDAALVLLGEDVSDPPGGISAPTVLIAAEDPSTASRTSADAFAAAARLGADHVAILPAAAEWLVQRMIAAVEPPVAPATTVGVVPGCGGAGATMLAAALAVEGQRIGLRTVLVDGDPLGGGIDLVLGAESTRRAPLARAGRLEGQSEAVDPGGRSAPGRRTGSAVVGPDGRRGHVRPRVRHRAGRGTAGVRLRGRRPAAARRRGGWCAPVTTCSSSSRPESVRRSVRHRSRDG